MNLNYNPCKVFEFEFKFTCYDRTYTIRVFYLTVTHSDPLCKLYLTLSVTVVIKKSQVGGGGGGEVVPDLTC